jgi:hypothetical protein
MAQINDGKYQFFGTKLVKNLPSELKFARLAVLDVFRRKVFRKMRVLLAK